MSFCCGASMIGASGTLKHFDCKIHNVPVVFCPVCHRVEVHHLIADEYELLAEFAHGDQAHEVDFLDFVEDKSEHHLFENCINSDEQDPLDVVLNQIDMALDLMLVAKYLEDAEWEQQLLKRLSVMSERRKKLEKQRSANRSR